MVPSQVEMPVAGNGVQGKAMCGEAKGESADK